MSISMRTVMSEPARMLQCLLAWLLAGVLAGMLAAPVAAEALTVTYPRLEGRDDASQFAFAVLKLALEKSGESVRLVRLPYEMTDARVAEELKKNSVDVAWLGISPELEAALLTVRIPITRGLLGKRICIINQSQQGRFSAVREVSDLRKLQTGLGIGWPITSLLRANDLAVTTVSRFDSLFKMVSMGRIDCIPLGANEARAFVKQFKAQLPMLAIEQHLVLKVPYYDFFFFVAPENKKLHALITKGLIKAYADGSYAQLYEQHPEHAGLKHIKLKSRLWLHLDNPGASPETMAIDASYWGAED
jgi:ABC-type amino acid transport substrate-binding protein